MSRDKSDSDSRTPSRRQYPAVYEKAVPIALALIALAIVVLLGIILVVALGVYPGG